MLVTSTRADQNQLVLLILDSLGVVLLVDDGSGRGDFLATSGLLGGSLLHVLLIVVIVVVDGGGCLGSLLAARGGSLLRGATIGGTAALLALQLLQVLTGEDVSK